MLDDLEINWGYVPATLILWSVVIAGTWFISLGEGGFGIIDKIIISAVALPVTYLIVSIVGNQ